MVSLPLFAATVQSNTSLLRNYTQLTANPADSFFTSKCSYEFMVHPLASDEYIWDTDSNGHPVFILYLASKERLMTSVWVGLIHDKVNTVYFAFDFSKICKVEENSTMDPKMWTGFEQNKTCILEELCRFDLDFSLQQASYQNPHCLPTKAELKK